MAKSNKSETDTANVEIYTIYGYDAKNREVSLNTELLCTYNHLGEFAEHKTLAEAQAAFELLIANSQTF